MAKRARAPAALLALLLAPAAHAEVKFTPSITGSETYSDNVALQTADLAQSSFVTEMMPGFSVVSNGPRLKLSADYQLHLYSYSNKVDNTNDTSSQYSLKMNSKVIEDLLDFDATASRQTTANSAFGPQGTDSLYASSNRSNVSTYTIAPTLRHRFGGTADVYLRYTRNKVSGDSVLGNSIGDNINANITSGDNFRVIGWGVSAIQDSFTDQNFGSTRSQNVEGNLRYRVGSTINLTATGGYDKYDYPAAGGGATQGPSWTGGFIWTPSVRTRLQMSYGRHYYGNTGSMDFTFRGHRSSMNASYHDTVTTSRQQFLATTTLSTAQLLDLALTSAVPDAAERAKIIADYIASTGVGTGVANNTNYFSNVFQRVKSFQAAYTLEGAHGTATLSVFKTRQTALSTQESSSDILGNGLASFNNNLDSLGATASYAYRMSEKTQAITSLNFQRSKTLDTDLTTSTEAVRLGLSHAFSTKLRGTAELRQTRGSYYNVGNARYRENAISATISQQF